MFVRVSSDLCLLLRYFKGIYSNDSSQISLVIHLIPESDTDEATKEVTAFIARAVSIRKPY